MTIRRFLLGSIDVATGAICVLIYSTSTTTLLLPTLFIGIAQIIRGILSMFWTSGSEDMKCFPEQHALGILDLLAGVLILISSSPARNYGLIVIGKGALILITYAQTKFFKI